MTKEYEMVREFMRAFGQRVPEELTMPARSEKDMRQKLICEEASELLNAEDITQKFDAVLDLLYVVLGAAVDCGFTPEQLSAGFAEVHRSNMSKMWTTTECLEKWPNPTKEFTFTESGKGDDRHIVRRTDGKIVKSPSYSTPRLEGIL